jgi:hypothetical protein
MTFSLPAVVRAWSGTDFSQVLKDEIESLGPGVLPLQQCTTQGGNIDDSDISVSVLSCGESGDTITAKLGIFFTEVVGGCNCHDDPVRENGYCEIGISIDMQTAIARLSPLSQENHSQL